MARWFRSISFSASRCASCIGESARAQWFRHSDGWRSGSSTFGSGSGQGLITSQSSSGHKRSPWDSLPSLRQDSSLNDSGYKSARGDSLEQRYPRVVLILSAAFSPCAPPHSAHSYLSLFFSPANATQRRVRSARQPTLGLFERSRIEVRNCSASIDRQHRLAALLFDIIRGMYTARRKARATSLFVNLNS